MTVVDLGANTFHLLVGRVRPQGGVEKSYSLKRLVRLGAGALARRWIDEAAWQRGMLAVAELVDCAVALSSLPMRVLGTSVLREAENGAAFASEITARFGITVEILDGAEEARLVYLGARCDADDRRSRAAVFDLGGGSLQIAVGEGDRLIRRESLPLGVLRLRGIDVAERVRSVAGEALAAVHALRPAEVVLAAGTARLVGRLAGGVTRLAADQAADLARLLATLDSPALLALGVPAGRLDTIAPGAAAIAELLAVLGVPSARIAAGGLREGCVVATESIGKQCRLATGVEAVQRRASL